MPTVATLPFSTKRRWDALAADQLRAELEQVSNERDALAKRIAELERECSSAHDYAWSEEVHRGALSDQLNDLLETARRAGISLRVRPIGMTRNGQIGLIQKAA